jgi:hypothetical protein
MKSQSSVREALFPGILIWSYVVVMFLYLIAMWLLRGQPDRLSQIAKYVNFVGLGCQLAVVVRVITLRRGVVPMIPVLIGGVSILGFFIFPRVWLLLLGGAMSSVGAILVGWPQLRAIFHRLSDSYREISASSKV